MYFVLAFLLTRVMRAVERKAKAGIGQAPEEGVGVLRKLNIRQQTDASRGFFQVPGQSADHGSGRLTPTSSRASGTACWSRSRPWCSARVSFALGLVWAMALRSDR